MIERSKLGTLGPLLGRGGLGAVYKIGYKVAGDPRDLAFKELRPENELLTAGFTHARAVKEMTNSVQARLALSPDDRKDLDETSAWPLDLVQDKGKVVGLVMPLIPSDYFIDTHQNGKPDRMVRDLSVMAAADKWAAKMGVDRTPFTDSFDRALILINLVYAVARLHKHRIVYGDLSLKNAAFSATSHNVLMLDCDGTASLDDLQRQQPHSPGFIPPEIANKSTRLQDTRTDVYKLALCIIRGLQQPSRTAMQASDPTILKPILGDAGVQELHRALDPDPNKRPTAKDLFNVLKGYHDAQTQAPVIHAFHPLSASVHRGGDVVLKWDVSNPDLNRGYLTHPDGSRHEVKLPDGQTSVKVDHSGTFRLEVVSPRGGVTSNDSELIQVFDLPQLLDVKGLTQGLGGVIAAAVPPLPTTEIPDFTHEVKKRPIVEIDADFLPQVGLPAVEDFLSGLSLSQQNLSSIQLVNDAMATVGGIANPITSVTSPDIGTRLALHSLSSVPAALRAAGLPVRTVLDAALGDLEDALATAAHTATQSAADRIRQHLEAQATRQTSGKR